ncbi:Cupredoxin [Lactifluus volemus]|nr:Cupredoxin [Lactifluus volemus]
MRSHSLAVFFAVISTSVYAQGIGPIANLPIANHNIAPDGFRRSTTLVGGQFPGPLIQGTKGANFGLTVVNRLTDRSMDLVTSIHWHGILQRTTNYADGAPFVTQCPIVPRESFRYRFSAEEQTGTYWYNSQLNAQSCDGLRGPLVIYDPNDPHRGLYDIDNEGTIITLGDWYHNSSPAASKASQVPQFDSTLINGKGRYIGGPSVPLAVVNVIRNRRYRLRIVSISCDPSFVFSIDGHQFTIIEVDGNNVQPLVVDSLEIFLVNVIRPFSLRLTVSQLNANQPIGNYWIRALPNIVNQKFTGFTNVAILRYWEPYPGIQIVILYLHPLVRDRVPGKPLPGGADININLDVKLSDDSTKFLINGVTFEPPKDPVLLQILNGAQSASDLVPKGSIYGLEGNKSVEITIPGGAPGGPRPIHLHGHSFHVVRSAGNSTYNFDNPVIRDVVSIGGAGDAVTIRFFTDNPGPWFLHSGNAWELGKGFAVVLAEDVPKVPTTDIATDTTAPRPLPPNLREPYTISYQRQLAKTGLIEEWGSRWRNSDRLSQIYIALPEPPSEAAIAPSSPPLSGSSPGTPSSAPTPHVSSQGNPYAAPAGHPFRP